MPTSISLRIPFPPTTNSIWRSVKGRNILSKRYREWRELAALEIDHQMKGQEPMLESYHMVIEYDRPDKRPRDLTNYAKAVEDSLVLCGVVRDDSDSVSVMLKWSDRTPAKGAKAHVELVAA